MPDEDIGRKTNEWAEAKVGSLFKAWRLLAAHVDLFLARLSRGQHSVKTGIALSALALRLQESKRLDEAVRYFQEAIDVFSFADGPEQPNLAIALFNLGALHLNQLRFNEAAEAYQRVVMIRERNPAQSGRKLGIALFKLAQAYERLSRFEDAIALCERGTPNVEKFEGPEPSSNTAYWN